MIISAQTICMCSPCNPQTGLRIDSRDPLVSPVRRRAGRLEWSESCFRKGRGSSTSKLAKKQASSFFPSAENASQLTVEVPAVDIGLSDLTGIKAIVKLVDSVSPAQLAAPVDDQLPSLLSMVIDGLPPLRQSEYVHEAETRMQQYVERYPTVTSLASYCRAGLSAASYANPGAISLDRIVAVSLTYGLLFVLDDIFFDIQDWSLLDQYGMSRSACGSPENIQEYFDHLGAILGQQVQPRNPAALIETMLWELGRDVLELSNPEWFRNLVEAFLEFQRSCVASEADVVQGHNKCFQDLESYTVMRAGNVAGKLTQLMTEFARDSYVPSILRSTPYFENVTTVVSVHIGFVNDVFSYHKESTLEQNPRNLITVLMECEGKPFVQTVYMAIDLVNKYGRALMDLEAEAGNSTFRNYFQGIIDVMAGNIYFYVMDKRYRHPDQFFPELRDMTASWKIVLDAKGRGL